MERGVGGGGEEERQPRFSPPPSRLTVSARLSTSATESRRRVSLVLPKDNPPQPLALHPGIHSPVKCTNIPILIFRRSAEENGTALQKAACLAACLKPSCVELTLCPTTESIRKGRDLLTVMGDLSVALRCP